jgi:hypothetical protein
MSGEAFQHAVTQWSSSKNIIFVTFTPGCGKFESNERCYYQSTSITFHRDSYSAVIIGSAKDIQEVTNHIELQWGDYSPGYSSNGGAPSSANGGAVSSPNGTPTSSTSKPTPTPSSNCTAPIDRKYGLPTTCLGYKFDDELDERLGFFNLSHFDYADIVADIALEYGDDISTDDGALSKRALGDDFRRGLHGVLS